MNKLKSTYLNEGKSASGRSVELTMVWLFIFVMDIMLLSIFAFLVNTFEYVQWAWDVGDGQE